jgi:hypothetical protein
MPMARSASLPLSISLILSDRSRFGLEAVSVALQDFLPDGFLDVFADGVAFAAVAFHEWPRAADR